MPDVKGTVYNMALAHSPRIVTNGLVYYVDAGNTKSYPGTGSTWSDLSGKANHSTLYDNPGWDSVVGGRLVFDGAADHATISASASLNSLTAITVSMWIKFPSIPFSGIPLNKEGSIRLFVGEANTTKFSIRLGSTWGTVIAGATTLQGNVWYNASATFDGTNVVLYLNGKSDYSGTQAGTFDNTATVYIGAQSAASLFCQCNIASVMWYNRALTADEVQQNFNAMRWRYSL